MASQRAASAINWTALSHRMPGGKSREVFAAAKNSAELLMTRIAANPATLPKIDWSYYNRMLPDSSMVSDFQAKYEALTIPYPVDAKDKMRTAESTDAAIKQTTKEIVAEVEVKCSESKKDIAFFEKIPPARSMTYEMYLELFPNADQIVPKDRETMEAELAEANDGIAAYKAKRV